MVRLGADGGPGNDEVAVRANRNRGILLPRRQRRRDRHVGHVLGGTVGVETPEHQVVTRSVIDPRHHVITVRVDSNIGVGLATGDGGVGERLARGRCRGGQQAHPLGLGLAGESDSRFDLSGAVLEHPVAAESSRAGQIVACGNVGTSDGGDRLRERAPVGSFRELAAVEKQVRSIRETRIPSRERCRMAAEV